MNPVLPNPPEHQTAVERQLLSPGRWPPFRIDRHSRLVRYGAALATVAAAVMLRDAMDPVVRDDFPLATIYGAVAVVVWLAGVGPAVVTAATGLFLGHWFFMEPRHTLPWGQADAVGMVLYAASVTGIIVFATQLRRAEARAADGERQVRRELARRQDMEEELRRASEEARRQFAELEAIYHRAPLGLCVLDTELRFRRINERLAEINGRTVAQHVGHTVHEVIPQLAAQGEAAMRRVLETGAPVRWELSGETPAQPGIPRVWDESWYPLRDASGRIFAVGLIVDDITERRRGEQALVESEQRFRALAENVPQLIWTGEADGAMTWYNHRWLDFSGMTPAELVGFGWHSLLHPDHLGRVTTQFRDAIRRREPWEDTFLMRARDGSHRWFLSRAFPIPGATGALTRWFGTLTDVTVLRRTQEALHEAQSRIRDYAQTLEKTVEDRTSRLRETVQELEAFSYSIAHDMRAPLRSMVGYSDILREEHAGALDAVGRDYLGRISAAARRLDVFIQDVLNYSRIVREELPLAPVDSDALVREILDTYPNLRAARRHVRIEGPLPPVLANVAALTQVLANLLDNAVKFVAPGAEPKVRLRADAVTGAGGVKADAAMRVRLWIEDNGIGIDPSFHARLFQMFQRFNGPASYEGTGIGLAIVRKAVERMGGQVGVVSAPGQGSRFWILLRPAPAGPAQPTTSHEHNS